MGFEFNSYNSPNLPDKIKGFGLFNIKERIELLGGQLEIESQPNRGTQVTLVAQLSKTV